MCNFSLAQLREFNELHPTLVNQAQIAQVLLFLFKIIIISFRINLKSIVLVNDHQNASYE